ncbi:MAG: EVE domain-containing protein [Nitrospirales bacterium]|nr:EVE domain-containing protein [Nitrospira sp.]MDR4459941.1 EVE domain-containing protein [Nitrospirales bacterium]MDR4483056.1 EVE domain-containing protein [Nitrospirales bacterium]
MGQYWLFKSEPTTFSIDDLVKSPRQTTCWEGVRNYQARNFLKSMNVGDLGFFYHSNADPPAIVGIIKVVKAAYPDSFAFDSKSRYFDSRSTPDSPRWFLVDVQFVKKFPQGLSLDQLRAIKGLEKMELLRKGSRLSIQPVRPEEWQRVLNFVQNNTKHSSTKK